MWQKIQKGEIKMPIGADNPKWLALKKNLKRDFKAPESEPPPAAESKPLIRLPENQMVEQPSLLDIVKAKLANTNLGEADMNLQKDQAEKDREARLLKLRQMSGQ